MFQFHTGADALNDMGQLGHSTDDCGKCAGASSPAQGLRALRLKQEQRIGALECQLNRTQVVKQEDKRPYITVMANWSIGRLQANSAPGSSCLRHSRKVHIQTGWRRQGLQRADLGRREHRRARRIYQICPRYDAVVHSHTNDVSIVVIKGAYRYTDVAGEKRVGPGGFFRVPGGHKHWSGGDKTEGALFYEECSGTFDFIPAK